MKTDVELLKDYWEAQAQFGPLDVGPEEYVMSVKGAQPDNRTISITITCEEADSLDSLLSSDIACMEDERLASIIGSVIHKIRKANRCLSKKSR